jgi:hypothetical protein
MFSIHLQGHSLLSEANSCALELMLFGAFVINVEISTNRLTPCLSEDRDSSYYQVVLDFGFSVRYTYVSFCLFSVFVSSAVL